MININSIYHKDKKSSLKLLHSSEITHFLNLPLVITHYILALIYAKTLMPVIE